MRDIDKFCGTDRRAWRLLYWFLHAYVHDTIKTLHIVNVKTEGDVKCFRADGLWYAVEGYLRYGDMVAPYDEQNIKEVRK